MTLAPFFRAGADGDNLYLPAPVRVSTVRVAAVLCALPRGGSARRK